MTELFLDLAGHGPDPYAVRAAGYTGVIGMLGGRGVQDSRHDLAVPGEPHFSPEAVRGFREAGLGILLAWRGTARRELTGQHGGAQDGATVRRLALARGYPSGCAVYVVVGLDAADAQLPAIDAYLRGFADACGYAPGVRGSARVMEALLGSGAARYGWQTQAWSGTYVSPGAHLYQRSCPLRPRIDGLPLGEYHENTLLQHDCGAWTGVRAA